MARFPLTLGESYLLEYPQADLPGADSYFYWEKVNFGLKPTIRASHYFPYRLGSLGLRFRHAKPGGFYLLTIKGSEQEGLTGPKGSILRKVVVDKTRSSLETALASIKKAVEWSVPASER
jgi:hypothetical protein